MVCSHSVWKNPSSLWWLSCPFLLSVNEVLTYQNAWRRGNSIYRHVAFVLYACSCGPEMKFYLFFKNKALYLNVAQNRLYVMCWRGGIATQQLFWKYYFSYFKALAESVSLCAKWTFEFPLWFPFVLSPWWRVFEMFWWWRHLAGVFHSQYTAFQISSRFIQMLVFDVQVFICLLNKWHLV